MDASCRRARGPRSRRQREKARTSAEQGRRKLLERAVEKKNARLANETSHLGVIHVLVDHDSLEHAAVLDLTAGDLFNFGVTFDVDIWPAILKHRSESWIPRTLIR